jgi:hypothetical protein
MRIWRATKFVWARVGDFLVAKEVATLVFGPPIVAAGTAMIGPALVWALTPVSFVDLLFVALICGLVAFFLARRFMPPVVERIVRVREKEIAAAGASRVSISAEIHRAGNRISLLQFRSDAVQHGWPANFNDSRWLVFLNALRQSAVDGAVPMYGRDEFKNRPPFHGKRTSQEPLLPIPAEHWHAFQIDPMSFLLPEREDSPRSYDITKSDWGYKKRFTDLHADAQRATAWLQSIEVPAP